jgi:hypothetical protein
LASSYETYQFKAWTPEIRFDDEVLYWKEFEAVEPRAPATDDEGNGYVGCASISSLWVQPWDELQSLRVMVLRAHRATPSPAENMASPDAPDRFETPDVPDKDSDVGDRPLIVLRDPDSERDAGVQIVSVEAWVIEDGGVVIVGELESASGKKLDEYRELQFVVYDAADRVLGRGYTNFSPFGRRQTFDEEVSELRPGARPAKVRVFPALR